MKTKNLLARNENIVMIIIITIHYPFGMKYLL